MFADTNHDFGMVARGSKVQYRFKFKNIYEEAAHVSNVRSSCSCTTPEVTKTDLKTWETSEVVANFNTNAFTGPHTATITVTFDKPFAGEVQLHVGGNIRTDVMLQPGQVELGSVDAGQGSEKKIALTHSGRSDWTISDVRSANTNFEVEVNETQRTASSVGYELIVRLKPTAPVGYIDDQLFLVTNDSAAPQIPIEVEGQVVAAVDVRPQSLSLGALSPGQTVTKNIVIISKRPFKVLDVEGGENVSCKLPAESRERQIIPLTFTAGTEPGRMTKKIRIKTDLGDNAVPDITCQATIVDPQSPATASGPGGTSTANRDRGSITAGFHDK